MRGRELPSNRIHKAAARSAYEAFIWGTQKSTSKTWERPLGEGFYLTLIAAVDVITCRFGKPTSKPGLSFNYLITFAFAQKK
jgi:hypothetical protein